jgi:hypothetical protein
MSDAQTDPRVTVNTFTENPREPRRIVGLIEIDMEMAKSPDRVRALDEQLEYLRGRLLGELEKIPAIQRHDPGVKISIELAQAITAVRDALKEMDTKALNDLAGIAPGFVGQLLKLVRTD